MTDLRSPILLRAHYETLFRVSQVLSRSLDFHQTLREVLRTLEITGHYGGGMVSVVDPDAGDLAVHVVYGLDSETYQPVRYQPGEGLVGMILEGGRTVAIARLGDEPRFLNRLGLYDKELPFIAAPIQAGGTLQGVLAVQPDAPDDGLLEERVRFVEMVANLIGQSVRLSLEVELERKTLAEERDTLRRTVRQKHGFDNLVGHSAPMRRIFEQIRLVAKWPTTVLIRATALARVTATKVLLYQLVVSAVVMFPLSWLVGERGIGVLSAPTLWAMAYQIVIVAFISYLAWFWLLTRYLAGRLLVFSFLTPLFGVLFGMLLMNDRPSLHFFVAATMVVSGIVLVNLRARN